MGGRPIGLRRLNYEGGSESRLGVIPGGAGSQGNTLLVHTGTIECAGQTRRIPPLPDNIRGNSLPAQLTLTATGFSK